MAEESEVITDEELQVLLEQIQYGLFHTGLSPWIFLKTFQKKINVIINSYISGLHDKMIEKELCTEDYFDSRIKKYFIPFIQRKISITLQTLTNYILNYTIPVSSNKIFSNDQVQLIQGPSSQVLDSQIENLRLKCVASKIALEKLKKKFENTKIILDTIAPVEEFIAK